MHLPIDKQQIVSNIENELREIFKKDVIDEGDILRSKILINQWKRITGYIPDNTPVLKQTLP